jgi:hypothetical protein
MEKGNVTLRDFLSLMGSASRIRIMGRDNKVIFDGYRAVLTSSEKFEAIKDREVKYFQYCHEFYKKEQRGYPKQTEYGQKIEDFTETADGYELKDICMKDYMVIFIY